MNEWEFTADVASWINELLQKDRNLPFSRAKCEQRGKGSLKRRDLTLLDKSQRVVLTGEVKLPYRKDGGSPYNASVVNDARRKAARAKATFFFTWNVNECVLWETVPPRTSWKDQNYKSWDVTSVHKESHMLLPMTIHAIQIWLPTFLNDLAQILHGTTEIGRKSPDEKFIEALESSLQLPILLTIEELDSRYKKSRFRSELDKWMRDEQGWIIYDDPEGVRDNIERTAKFTCYAMVNKLVFYEALLKRFGVKMQKLAVPDHIPTGDALRLHLEGYFAEARVITGDYETVFGEDHTSIGNRIPFYSDHAVAHWRALIDQIHKFDFSKLDYEVIGSIFEHLISPEERHKFGQFYTSVEVVDLINSFCIRDGHEKVMDPACGGGTFLVRAYARKRELAPAENHGKRLSELFGIDISQFATHLTTINLATRDLIDDENYPQIARSDFFDIEAKKPFLSLPTHVKARGLGKIQHRKVEIPQLDAVVGNPPYIRQEDIPKSKSKKRIKHGTKEYYQQLIKRESGASFSGRSDIHCYFWPHATSFLKDGGSLSLVTSSQWLDVEYGFKLQDWMLQHFQILAVFESIDEPWFVGARVATTVTILRRQKDTSNRMNNIVRFVQLRRPVKELLGHDGTTAGAVRAADTFRDEILGLKDNTVNDRYRARLIRQGDLWNNGVRLGVMMGKSSEPPSTDPSEQSGHYYGGKWGVYLRAPDLWFDLLDAYGSRFAPLGDLADVRFGVKSGKDCFFFPKDCSQACLDAHQSATDFRKEYGVPRKDVQSGKVKLVLCGEGRGEVRPIEAEYLEPEVHSLMEVDQYQVDPSGCAYSVLLIDKPREQLKHSHVLKYIRWGERCGYHTTPTCSARATREHEWYDLTQYLRPDIILPKIQQYRLLTFLNPHHLYQNSSLLGLYGVAEADILPFCAVLNSTVSILSRLMYARILGNEGNIQLDVYSAKMMLIPNLKGTVSRSAYSKLVAAFRKMTQRKALAFISERRLRRAAYLQKDKGDELQKFSDRCELDMDDRRELDDAVFELLGVTHKEHRQKLIDALYVYLRDYFEWTRQKEEKAIVNKKKAKRRGPARPAEIAKQIYDELIEKRPDFLKEYDPDFLDRSKPFDTFDIPAEGEAQVYSDMLVPHAVRFTKGNKELAIVATNTPSQDALLVLLIKSGSRGLVRVPHEEQICRDLLAKYDRFIQQRVRYVLELIKDRTADEDMQEAIFEAAMPLLRKE